jgi:uncharacterized protein YndB with AHSA1/START domain
MSRIVTSIDINAPIERVFSYATTAGNWPKWHPASLGVSGATNHSGEVGERIVEEFRAAGRRGRAVWTVHERVPPGRWVIQGRAEGGGHAAITYHLTVREGGTRFERELIYRMPNPLWGVLDWLLIRRRMAAESALALGRLKTIVERDLAG